MYARHFGLSAEPFSLTPDPAFLYLSPGHREALAALKVGLLRRCGMMLMTGEVGSGKTTLLYALLSEIEPNVRTAYVANTRVSFVDLLRLALADFGVPIDGVDKVDLLHALNTLLHQCAADGTCAALVVDEAQNLDDEAFEDLRLLSNFERFDAKLLQIIMVGQPELAGKLGRSNLRQIEERIAVRASIEPLSRGESAKYIDHRLRQVGGSVELFSQPARARIIRAAAGIPRRINILCDSALMFTCAHEEPRVTWRRAGAAVRARRRVRRSPRLPQRPSTRTALATGAVAAMAGGVLAITQWPTFVGSDAARMSARWMATASGAIPASGRSVAGASAAARAEGPTLAGPAPALQDTAARGQTVSEAAGGARLREAVVHAANDALPGDEIAEAFASVAADAPIAVAAAVERSRDDSPSSGEKTEPAFESGADSAADGRGEPSMPADARRDTWPKIVTVAPGANLIRLVATVYGRNDPALLELVQSANPQVVDRNQIRVGTRLSFPAAPAPPVLPAAGGGGQP